METRPSSCPPPRWAFARWLYDTHLCDGLDAQEKTDACNELRNSMFRRMESLVISAVVTMMLTIIAVLQHPTFLFMLWSIEDIAFNVVRLAIVLSIMWSIKPGRKTIAQLAWVADTFIIFGCVWCLQVGVSTGMWIATGDPALGVLGCLLALGTVGGQCARTPGASRVTAFQMYLIEMPFSVGALLSPVPTVHFAFFLMPIYLFGMITINRQLNADYVEMIIARLENRRLALHCALTGLPNRVFFRDHVTTASGQVPHQEAAGHVLYLDLDGFKTVNDDLGHAVGDDLLCQVGRRLQSVVTAPAIAARLGGDEFAVFVPKGERLEIEALAHAIIDLIGQTFLIQDQHTVSIGISIGLVRNSGEGIDALLAKADQALYVAKRSGKGTFRWHHESAMAETTWNVQSFAA